MFVHELGMIRSDCTGARMRGGRGARYGAMEAAAAAGSEGGGDLDWS